jgi:DNA repair exonuclease SbcCD ATPase subunit
MIQANIAERRQAETTFEEGVEGYKKGLSKDAAKKFLEEAERGKMEAIIKKDKEIRDLKEQIKTIKDSTTVKSKLQENLTKQLNAAVLAQNTAEVRELLKQINPKLDEYIKKGEENKQNKGNEPQKPKEVDQNDWNALRNKAKAIQMSDPDLDTKINKLKDEYHTKYPAIGYKTVRNLIEFMGKQKKKKGGSYNETLRNYFRNNRATRRRF